MKTWLIYPPFADPTQPYLSLPYLKGYLKERGKDATVVDLNCGAAHFLLGSGHIRRCVKEISSRFFELNGKKRLSPFETAEYIALAEAREAALRLLEAHASPADLFRDPARFYDFKRYTAARDMAEDALTCVSALSFPYRFHFNHASHMALPWGTALLKRYFIEKKSPLRKFYEDFIVKSGIRPGDAAGISVTFISQIPEAFYLAMRLREKIPSLFILFGGSAIQQIFSHAEEDAKRYVLTVADGACIFEGEACLSSLVDVFQEEGWNPADPEERFRRLGHVPNLVMLDPVSKKIRQGPLTITDLSVLPPPDYSDLDLGSYLAPEPVLLFSPTRGCYWNRCAFCDYGLNRTGCHGYREMDAEEAARHLIDLSHRYRVKNFYLSVDAMGPRFVEKLAQALVDGKADIRWSADFRMEAHYTAKRLALLYQSGLRAVAFGVESGADSMLGKMEKGITVDTIRRGNALFHQAGIATAWMTFSHHPGETETESLETIRLIDEARHAVDLFILGRFGLTSGARIFNDPQAYGLRRVYYCRGDDFHLFPLFQELSERPSTSDGRLEDEIARLSRHYYLDHYPWRGAISTHHTFLYFLKFGQDIFQRLARKKIGPEKKSRKRLSGECVGLICRPAFSLDRLEVEHGRFMESFLEKALSPDQSGMAPLSGSFFRRAFFDG